MKKVKNMFEKHDLFKIVILAIILTLVLTWIIPFGNFSGENFSSTGLGRTGIVDLILANVYSANFFLQQILFVLFIGIFYGIISKTNGYKNMVSNIAKKFKGKEKIFVVLTSLIITLMTTFFTQSFVVLIFVPLIISICNKLNLDKITGFLCTFGSILVGMLGATYGTEGLIYFVSYLNYYQEVELTTELGLRFGILALTFIVFNFFTVKHLKSSSSKNEDKIVDVFEVGEENKKAKVWPMALFFIIVFVCVVLGYINWEGNFEIKAFTKFHTWLTELHVGDYNIISYIIGNNASAFGAWELYSISVILFIILLLTKFIYSINLDEMIDNAYEGLKTVIKPVLLLVLVYVIFVLVYWTPFTATITNWVLNLSDKFNPFLTTIAAIVASVFHTDFGFTGYLVGDFITTFFADSFSIGFVIYVAINGLVQIIAPTSAMLLIGLSYLDIPYKKWFKYIWKFVLIMLAILLVIFSLLTYL